MKIFYRIFLAVGGMAGAGIGLAFVIFLTMGFKYQEGDYAPRLLIIAMAIFTMPIGAVAGMGIAAGILWLRKILLKMLEDPSLTDDADTYIKALGRVKKQDDK